MWYFRTSSFDDSELSEDLLEDEDELEKAQIILPLRDKKANIGSSVKFSCRAQSITNECSVDWYFNDNKITDGSRVKLSVEADGELFCLNKRDLRITDSGRYNLVFNTPHGKLESSALLDVEGNSFI